MARNADDVGQDLGPASAGVVDLVATRDGVKIRIAVPQGSVGIDEGQLQLGEGEGRASTACREWRRRRGRPRAPCTAGQCDGRQQAGEEGRRRIMAG